MGKVLAAVLVLVALATGAIALSARGSLDSRSLARDRSGPREIRMVVRNMTFYVEGQSDPNPTLRLRAGETVRLILRNDDAGMTHDFAIPDWKAATKWIEGGQQATVTFRAPDQRTSQTYNCQPHALMMRGTILVE